MTPLIGLLSSVDFTNWHTLAAVQSRYVTSLFFYWYLSQSLPHSLPHSLPMDDVLGDFFSEIEKVEVETVAAKDDSSIGEGEGVGVGTSSVGNHPSTSSAVSGTVSSALSSAVSKVDGSHTVSVEVKSAKPVPNITYVAASKPVSPSLTHSLTHLSH